MATGTITREFADDFPAITRKSTPTGPRRTDVDVALESLQTEAGDTLPTKAMKVIDYNRDADGQPVDEQAARQRAHARVQAMRKRGYTKDSGWRLAAIDGCVWAQFYGPGNHPVKATKETKAEVAAATPAADSVPAPV